MVREDLVEGAVTFLQDPSVSSSPIEQKVAFLRSKNLTQGEIDASLARVGQPSSTPSPLPSNYPQQYRPPPQQQYGGYQQPPYWGQGPPEPPRRDWRDWFIMATVVSGASYAMYWTAKRYIYPLIAPPTPPQLEQDKASIDESFDKAFALLDQLATDTQELKDSEKARKERLDNTLSEVESVINKMKEANEAREMEAKRMAMEISEIRDAIPEAIQREKAATDKRVKELIGEVKSLRTLVDNRMGGAQRPPRNYPIIPGSMALVGNGTAPATTPVNTTASAAAPVNGTAAPTTATPAPETIEVVNGSHEEAEKPASVLPDRSSNKSLYGRILGNGKAQIPAWQLAAKKNDEEKKEIAGIPGVSMPGGVSESGTMAEGEAGA